VLAKMLNILCLKLRFFAILLSQFYFNSVEVYCCVLLLNISVKHTSLEDTEWLYVLSLKETTRSACLPNLLGDIAWLPLVGLKISIGTVLCSVIYTFCNRSNNMGNGLHRPYCY